MREMFFQYQSLFWLENKITEHQWKLAETIYIPFQKISFWPILIMSGNFQKTNTEENSRYQLNKWKKITPAIYNIYTMQFKKWRLHLQCSRRYRHIVQLCNIIAWGQNWMATIFTFPMDNTNIEGTSKV